MRTFIQLRDGIGYATLTTPADAPDHTITPDHTTAVEVFTENPEQFLKMKYDLETKSWLEAQVLRYAEINPFGDIIEIKYTVFTHEIDHDTKLMEDDTTTLHKWRDGEWILPSVVHLEPLIVQSEPQTMIESPQILEEHDDEQTVVEETTN